MKYWNISGREADQARRMVKDIQYSKRHKDLQELHIWREQMRKGANDMSKINEWRGTWPTSSLARGSALFKTSPTSRGRGMSSSLASDCKVPPLSKSNDDDVCPAAAV